MKSFFAIFMLFISIPKGNAQDMAQSKVMFECIQERREKCKGLRWSKCKEQGLVSQKCMNAFGMLDGLLVNLKAANCASIANVCPIDINKFKGEQREASQAELAKCLRDNQDFIPKSCKDFMTFMNNPAFSEQYQKQLNDKFNVIPQN